MEGNKENGWEKGYEEEVVGGKKNGLSIWINMLVKKVGKGREVDWMMESRRSQAAEGGQGKGKPSQAVSPATKCPNALLHI